MIIRAIIPETGGDDVARRQRPAGAPEKTDIYVTLTPANRRG